VRFRWTCLGTGRPGCSAFGAAAPLTHPATGYQLAESLRLASAVAETATSALGTGPDAALAATQALLWPPSARAAHLLRRRGLEALLRLHRPGARVFRGSSRSRSADDGIT